MSTSKTFIEPSVTQASAEDAVSLPVRNLKSSPQRFFNRELTWLEFNNRVLEEATDMQNPLLERLRFLSIAGSNLDEFYMVRVAGLQAQVDDGITVKSIDGKNPKEQLKRIHAKAKPIIQKAQSILNDLFDELAGENIHLLKPNDLNTEDKEALQDIYENEIFPILSPIAIDPAHPFPFVANKELVLALRLQAGKGKNKQFLDAVIPVPPALDRFIRLPGDGQRFILLEDVIMMHLSTLFSPFKLLDHTLMRIIRDSELEVQEEAEDIVRNFETALKRRKRGSIILLVVRKDASEEILEFLSEELQIASYNILHSEGFVGLSDLSGLITDERTDLMYAPYRERYPERIKDFNGDCFAAIKAKDLVIHHPYESFDVVVQFLKQAASDPNVLSIRQTLYRTSKDSPIVKALIEAAEAGKSVTAVVELKARFDEEANIKWAKDLEDAGAQVVFGFVDYKTHAKMSLIARRENNKIVQYAHFGTGNYHPSNAKIYTDLSFFTCDPVLCTDAVKTFNFMTGYAMPSDLEKLHIAPISLRNKLVKLIDGEIKNAKKGKPAAIWAKMNSLVDSKMIDKLYEASSAGVDIHLVVRGICCLRPGIKGLSENIEVRSVIGRFLEHSRIYAFANGKGLPSKHAQLYISSADLMTRNMDHRIEAFVPIENRTVHQQVLDQIMVANLVDTTNSWVLQYDGSYKKATPDDEGIDFSAHDYFMTNPSLSGRGSALDENSMPPRLWFSQKNK